MKPGGTVAGTSRVSSLSTPRGSEGRKLGRRRDRTGTVANPCEPPTTAGASCPGRPDRVGSPKYTTRRAGGGRRGCGPRGPCVFGEPRASKAISPHDAGLEGGVKHAVRVARPPSSVSSNRVDRSSGDRVYPGRRRGEGGPGHPETGAVAEGAAERFSPCSPRLPGSLPLRPTSNESRSTKRNRDVAAVAGEQPAQGWAGPRTSAPIALGAPRHPPSPTTGQGPPQVVSSDRPRRDPGRPRQA